MLPLQRVNKTGWLLQGEMLLKAITKIIIVLAVLLCLAHPVRAEGTLKPYHPAADTAAFELEDAHGQLHRLSDYQGKVLLINFWASWCAPCIQEIPSMQRAGKSFAEHPFDILAINVSEQKQSVLRRLKRLDMTLTVLFDPKGKTFQQWQAKILPTSFLVDKKGTIRYQVNGPLEWDSDEASAIIDKLLNE